MQSSRWPLRTRLQKTMSQKSSSNPSWTGQCLSSTERRTLQTTHQGPTQSSTHSITRMLPRICSSAAHVPVTQGCNRPEELGQVLLKASRNKTAYMEYHAWRKHGFSDKFKVLNTAKSLKVRLFALVAHVPHSCKPFCSLPDWRPAVPHVRPHCRCLEDHPRRRRRLYHAFLRMSLWLPASFFVPLTAWKKWHTITLFDVACMCRFESVMTSTSKGYCCRIHLLWSNCSA